MVNFYRIIKKVIGQHYKVQMEGIQVPVLQNHKLQKEPTENVSKTTFEICSQLLLELISQVQSNLASQKQNPETEIVLNNKYRLLYCKYVKDGAFGVVNKAINMQNNEEVAVKQIKYGIGQDGLQSAVHREKAILRCFNHENIVKLIESFIFEGKAYLVFPYFQKNLRQFIHAQYNNNLPQNVVKKIMRQLLNALKTAHSARLMHRDIKMENIMVEFGKNNPEDFVIKLADWGSSRKFNIRQQQSFTYYLIPKIYRPPELLLSGKYYNESVDIWTVGCLFYELIFNETMFQYTTDNQLFTSIQDMIGLSQTEDEHWIIEEYEKLGFKVLASDLVKKREKSLQSIFRKKLGKVTEACDLMKKMLRINPQSRISAFDALKHPYLHFNNN